MLPRAIWTFHDACPVKIVSEDWNYGPDNVVKRQVEFAYNYYALNADPGITALQTVASVAIGSDASQDSQPVEISKGGITSHGSGTPVNINDSDKLQADTHAEGQPVIVPTDDMVSRSINIGLDILNGNTNVKIASDDIVNKLRLQGEELLNNIKIPRKEIMIAH